MVNDRGKRVGRVGIEVKRNRYRLRLPREVASGSKRYISTGLEVSESNYRKVQQMAWELEDKLATVRNVDEFEVRKTEDSKPTQLTLVQTLRPQVSLMELWLSYCEFMKPQLAETTYIKKYESQYTNHVKNLDRFNFTTVDGVCSMRDELLKTTSPYTTRRVLAKLSGMVAWGMKSKRLTLAANPFTEVIAELIVPKDKLDPDPFTLEERDAILTTFKNHTTHNHYYNFVRFLFLTGCRTGECIGLQWKHVSKDYRVITFAESYDSKLNIRN